MANGSPGRPRKYTDGFMHLDFLMPVEMVRHFEDYCEKFHLSKTDTLHIALNYCFMSEAEREAKLREVAFENEFLRKDNAQISEERDRYKNQLDALLKSQAAGFQVRSPKADLLMKRTKEMLAQGELTPASLAFRCDQLRPYLKDRSVPEAQRAEIIAFIQEMVPHA